MLLLVRRLLNESDLLYLLCRYLVEFVLPGDEAIARDDISLDSGFSDEEMELDTEGAPQTFMLHKLLSTA